MTFYFLIWNIPALLAMAVAGLSTCVRDPVTTRWGQSFTVSGFHTQTLLHLLPAHSNAENIRPIPAPLHHQSNAKDKEHGREPAPGPSSPKCNGLGNVLEAKALNEHSSQAGLAASYEGLNSHKALLSICLDKIIIIQPDL